MCFLSGASSYTALTSSQALLALIKEFNVYRTVIVWGAWFRGAFYA